MTGFIATLLLPWLAGSLWLGRFWREANLASVLGYGYLTGILATTLLMRLWHQIGLELAFWPLAAALAIIGGLSFLIPRPRINVRDPASAAGTPPPTPRPDNSNQGLWTWANLIFAVFLLLIVLRIAGISVDNLYRPLFSWDTWMNFAPKAKVWFELKEMVTFVSPGDWLNGASLNGQYTLSNAQATGYPPAVPLIMLWTALGLDTWHEELIKIPWLLCSVALGLGVYGQLRHFDIPRHLSILFVYLLLSVPYLNVHMTLAGYADFWLGATLCLGFLSLIRWHRTRDHADLSLAVLFALLCFLIKTPGAIWGSLLLISIIVAVLPRNVMLALAAVLLISIVTMFALGGLDITLPGIGRLRLNESGISLPYLGSQRLGFRDISEVLLTSLFLSPNWNLLWYALGAGVLIGLAQQPGKMRDIAPFFFIVASIGAYLFIFYMIPRYSAEAVNQTTLNRALLHLAPSLFGFVIWWLWGKSSASQTKPK